MVTSPFTLVLETDNPLLEEKYMVLMKKAFDIDATKAVGREETLRVLAAMKWIDNKDQIKLPIQ